MRLADLDGAFTQSFLESTAHAANEIVGAPSIESGWFRLDGLVAQSSAHTIVDPAVYAVLIERAGAVAVVDLPFELCTQTNGDLLPVGPFGDL